MAVLVVDDEQMIRTIAEKILRRAGFEVLVASSGVQAVDIFRSHGESVELAVVDMSMEGMSGLDTIRELRRIDPQLSVIISSGNELSMSDIPRELSENTFFLQKPYRAGQLSDFVLKVLRSSSETA